jgi:FkbM family methyltransferase
MNLKNICDHTFISNNLTSNSLVFDCGSNHGEFATEINRIYNCNIIGFEPDPRLFNKLPILEKCKFFKLAISDKRGVLTFNLGEEQCSSLFYKEKNINNTCEVNTTDLESYCIEKNIPKIDLLKLDIEGAELLFFNTISSDFLSNHISQITVEFHEFLDPKVIPNIKETIKKMKNAGFYYKVFSRTYGDVLFINKKFIRISMINDFQISYIKYKEGIKRIIKRALNKNTRPNNQG